jgi:hypothetical protein
VTWPRKPGLQEAVCGSLSPCDTQIAVGLRNGLRVHDVRVPEKV